jgi:hypothetical protein
MQHLGYWRNNTLFKKSQRNKEHENRPKEKEKFITVNFNTCIGDVVINFCHVMIIRMIREHD